MSSDREDTSVQSEQRAIAWLSNTIVRLAEYRDDYLVSQLVMGLRAAVRSESDPEYARRILARVSHEVRRRGHVGMAALIEHVAGTTN